MHFVDQWVVDMPALMAVLALAAAGLAPSEVPGVVLVLEGRVASALVHRNLHLGVVPARGLGCRTAVGWSCSES